MGRIREESPASGSPILPIFANDEHSMSRFESRFVLSSISKSARLTCKSESLLHDTALKRMGNPPRYYSLISRVPILYPYCLPQNRDRIDFHGPMAELRIRPDDSTSSSLCSVFHHVQRGVHRGNISSVRSLTCDHPT
jgi:hypothetical protein